MVDWLIKLGFALLVVLLVWGLFYMMKRDANFYAACTAAGGEPYFPGRTSNICYAPGTTIKIKE